MQFFHIVTEKDMFRTSHRRCSVTKGVLRNFTKLTVKCLCQSPFFNKVARAWTLSKNRLSRRCFPVNFAKFLRITFVAEHLRPATSLKKRPCCRCFLVNFVKFLRTLFVTEHLRWLLLYVVEEKLQQSKLKS